MKKISGRKEPTCPYCGNQMTLVCLGLHFPPDLKNQYECLRCGSAAPKATSPEDAYKKATRRVFAFPTDNNISIE